MTMRLTNFCFLILLGVMPCTAQIPASASQAASSSAAEAFRLGLRHDLPVYTGSAYVGYGQNISGSAFFAGDSLAEGDILFDGILYKNVVMGYDLVSDLLVVKDFTNDLLLTLVSSRVGYFRIGKEWFVSNSGSGNQETGFFQVAYNGRHSVFIKRKRQVLERIVDDRVLPVYEEYDTYFLLVNGKVMRINRAGDLYRAFSSKKTLLRKQLHTLKLQFKRDPQKTLVAAARFYDSQ